MSGKHDKSHKSVDYFNYYDKPVTRISLESGYLVILSPHRGYDESGKLVSLNDDGSQRIRQAYRNLKQTIESIGANMQNVIKIMAISASPTYRNVIDRVQQEPEFYGSGNSPPRTLIFANLPDDDIFEILVEMYISHSEIKELKQKLKESKSLKAQGKHNRPKVAEPEYSEDSVNTEDNEDDENNDNNDDDDDDESDEPKHQEAPPVPSRVRDHKSSTQKSKQKGNTNRSIKDKVVQAVPIKNKHGRR